MHLSQFCLAHCYRPNSYLSVVVDNLRRRCLELCPSAEPPKLGNHTTLLPPFLAHPDEMKNLARGLRIAGAYYGKDGINNYAKTQAIDFFRNPDLDACVLKVVLPRNYHDMILECRKELPSSNEWVFPISGDEFNPHICIAEGENLYDVVSRNLSELDRIAPEVGFLLPFPTIMVKEYKDGVARWSEFEPGR